MNNETVKQVEGIIGYSFRQTGLLEQAFIRSSWANEHGGDGDNEVLEFLGDRVLDLVVTKKLAIRYGTLCSIPRPEYVRKWYREMTDEERERFMEQPGWEDLLELRGFSTGDRDEGSLTRIRSLLVRTDTLAAAMDRLGLADHLITGEGDQKAGVEHQPRVKEDLFEAILGAAALDCGWDLPTLEGLVDRMLDPDGLLDEGLDEQDYQALVQQRWQAEHDGARPPYQFREADGSGLQDQRAGFFCSLPGVWPHETMLPEGVAPERDPEFFGRSKKEAAAACARAAWEYMQAEEDAHAIFRRLVGTVTEDNAINKLQELWQKGYIREPAYTFSKETGCDGEDEWACECSVNGIGWEATGCSTKLEAKKEAAWQVLDNMEYETYFTEAFGRKKR